MPYPFISPISKPFNPVNPLIGRGHYEPLTPQIASQSPVLLAKQAASLAQVGYFSKAADFLLKAIQQPSSTLKDLEKAIYFSGLAGRFYQVTELLKIWDKRSPQKAHRFSSLATEVTELMAAQQVSEAELEKLIILTLSILHQHHLSVAPHQIDISVFSGEDCKWFHYMVLLPEVSIEEAVQLNFELAERSVRECSTTVLMGSFVPSFQSLKED